MRRELVKPALLLHFTLAVYCLLPGIMRAQSGPTVWVAPSLERVGPTDAPGASTQAQISAAKGEYESFQIVVRAPSGSSLTNINVAVSDLTSSAGQIISKSNLTLYREQYVHVTSSSPDWGGSNRPLAPGWYADGLIPFVNPATGVALSGATLQAVPYNLAAGTNQPFWVDVFVPLTAAAGYYTGSYTVSSVQGTVSGQISLHVWNFSLPQQPTLKSSFAYFQAGTLAAQQELLRNRVMPLSVSASDEAGLMSGYGLSSNDVGPWSGADVTTCQMSAAPSVSQFQTAASAQQKGLYLFDYSADEVGGCTNLYPTLKQWAYNMHQAGINNLVTMAPVTALFDDGSGTGRSAVDDWVVLPEGYNSSVSTIQQAIQKGDSVWSYNTLVQDSYSPKWEIDFAPINFRIQPGFINQSLNLTGLLYWKVDNWSSDPWNNVNNAGLFSSNNYPGEGMLVYPGQTVGIAGVAPSMRLKWIRDGVDDFEYINLLKKAGQGAWAIQIAQTMGPDWTNWTRDINALESAREQLGQKLDTLGGGAGSAPSVTGSPSPANGATAVSTTPTLSWGASTGATSYDVYFGTSSSPSLVANVTGPSYKTATLGAGTGYYWKVVAKNSAGSTSSATWSFTTNPPVPSVPGSPSPASGTTGVSTTPTLSWAASTNTTSYDVYFGTSSTPPLVRNVTSTSYQPGSLSAGTPYYWRVVAKNTGGSTSSATWSFTTAGTIGPAAVSVSPSSGSALYQVFNFVYSDSYGYANLTGLYLLFNTSLSGTSGCWIYYDTAGKTVSLAQDGGTAWNSTTLGSTATIQNSQCSFAGNGVSVTGSGNNLTLQIALTFKTAFAGTKQVYMRAVDTSIAGGYVARGTWSVPASTAPVPVSVGPSSGSGTSQLFSFAFSDPYGYQNLSGTHVVINSSFSTTNSCWIYYDAVGKVIWLAQDSTAGWNSMSLGSTATLQNSQCTLTGSGASVTGSGTNLTLKIPITFKSAFAGTRNVYMSATDKSGVASSYIQLGTWTVQ